MTEDGLASSREQEQARGAAQQNDARALEQAYHALVTAYVAVLNEISTMPRFAAKGAEHQPAGPLRDLATSHYCGDEIALTTIRFLQLRYFVQLFAETHIKSKCSEMEAAFARQQQTYLSDDVGKAARDRLDAMQKSCKALADSLSSWNRTRLFWTTVGPLFVTILVGLLGLQSIWDPIREAMPSLLTWQVAIAIGLTTFWLGLYPLHSFWYKRQLFLPGNMIFDMSKRKKRKFINEHPEWANYQPARNIYDLENLVFEKLHRQKKLEVRIDRADHLIDGLVLTPLGLSLVSGVIPRPSGDFADSLVFWIGVVFIAWGLFALISERSIRHPAWR